jgi:hypothetical protein
MLFSKVKFIACSILVEDDSGDTLVLMPDLSVHVSVVVGTEEIEEDIDRQDWVAHRMVEVGFQNLPDMLVLFEKGLLRVQEIKSFLEFKLLAEYFSVETNELSIAFKVGFFHQLE